MAKSVDKARYSVFLRKGEEHEDCAAHAFSNKGYNAAVSNYSIAIINYLDALSINRFGKDLSSGNHEAAPYDLNKSLNGSGISDFKELASECGAVLKMKNLASYQAKEIGNRDAQYARGVTDKVKAYVEEKIDRTVGS
jgi:hypothetical protein